MWVRVVEIQPRPVSVIYEQPAELFKLYLNLGIVVVAEIEKDLKVFYRWLDTIPNLDVKVHLVSSNIVTQ